MVVGLITSLGVGLLLAVLGVLLCRGQLISLIAEHCRLNVKEENYGPYTRLVGLVAARKDPKEFAQVCAAYAVFLRRQMVDFPKSGEYYEKAIAAVPDAYEYHQDYAVLLLNDLKDYPKAKTELEEVLRLKPNSISARKNYDLLMKTKYDKDGNLKKPSFFSRFRH